jgi:hypothetical protein
MQSTERKTTNPCVTDNFLTVPDETIAGGLSIRFAPTIRTREGNTVNDGKKTVVFVVP